MKKAVFLILILTSVLSANAQFIRNFGVNDTTYNAGKIRLVGISSATAYTGAIYGLSTLWYTNKGPFKWFNDNSQWKQIDKMGHGITAYHESKVMMELFHWAGVKKKGWLALAGMSGFIFQLPIEILDGTSPQYGASSGDLIANFSGAALLTAQEVWLDGSYIHPKFSFHPSPIARAQIRPGTHGTSLNEQILKDYNGQTYWLAVNLDQLFPLRSEFNVMDDVYYRKRMPPWLCIAFGYGAEHMVYGNPIENQANGYKAYRQFYLAPSIDFMKIPTRRKGMKMLFYVLNIFQPPMPALEINKNGMTGHLLYF